uniref:Translation initiation factor 5A C-terminal domain-containing protein n=1 Tax=Oryza brachyantha TaxID=4533 RepID=J3MI46_ORYBR
MVTQSTTLLVLTFSMEKNLKILHPRLITVMQATFLHHIHIILCFFSFNFLCYPRIMRVSYVDRTDYKLIDVSEDGFLSFLTECSNTKYDLSLPTNDTLTNHI